MLTPSTPRAPNDARAGAKIGRAANVDGQELNAELPGRAGQQLRSRRGAGRIAKDGKALARWHDLPQDLKSLCVELASDDANPGGVAAGLG